MDKETIKAIVATRVAKELKDGDVVNLGIGVPTAVPNYLPEDVKVIIHAENGIIGAGPQPKPEDADPVYITDAGGDSSSILDGGCFIDSSTSFMLVRGGHIDCTVLGALQVDKNGNLANWNVPGKRLSGMGGAMDLVVGAKKVIIAMEHTARGAHKIMNECKLPLTAVKCVDLIVTEMGVIEVTKDGLLLKEYNPEFTVEEIQAATEAPLIVSDQLKSMLD